MKKNYVANKETIDKNLDFFKIKLKLYLLFLEISEMLKKQFHFCLNINILKI